MVKVEIGNIYHVAESAESKRNFTMSVLIKIR